MDTLSVDSLKITHPAKSSLDSHGQGRILRRSHSLRSWGDSREQTADAAKDLLAEYFVNHDFLVREGDTPEQKRETVASIIVNQGTTPNRVVKKAVEWVRTHNQQGPFFLTWYTPGHLVPVTLREARESNRHLRTALRLFLFPGEVDDETESVSGPDAERFVEHLQTRFTYAFLSSYSLDLETGGVYFFSPQEIRLQRACATRFAADKFLFLDSSKFKCEGERGYGISDLLETSYHVTLYTEASAQDSSIRSMFENLSGQLGLCRTEKQIGNLNEKSLRLRIVGKGDKPSQTIPRYGELRRRATQKKTYSSVPH